MRSHWLRPQAGSNQTGSNQTGSNQASSNKASEIRLMGVLNCTPDSFSDGGCFVDTAQAIEHGLCMFEQGAAIIDVGGESTRPDAKPISLKHELERVIPVVKGLVAQGCLVSIDSMKAAVMSQAIEAGASMVNDVSALSYDADSLALLADTGIDVCLMHMQGSPQTMQQQPRYGQVVDDVTAFFEQRIDACLQAGIKSSAIMLDPGIGFGKRLQDNLDLIQATAHFKQTFGMPILLGVSRKSFLGQLTGSPVSDREIETAVAGAMGIAYGADMLRVHDVVAQKRAIQVASALSAIA